MSIIKEVFKSNEIYQIYLEIKRFKDSSISLEAGDKPNITVGPLLNLNIAEGSSVLLEVNVSSMSEDPAIFEWLHEGPGKRISSDSSLCVVNNHDRFSSSILFLHVKSLKNEGAYMCNVKVPKILETLQSPHVLVSVDTPLDACRSTLTTFYTKQPEVPEDTWPPVSCNSYTSLALIKQGSISSEKFSCSTIRGDMDDIYYDKESIMYKTAFNKLESGACLLVEGRPGSGKTTLVQKVSKDWATGELSFLHNKLLILELFPVIPT